MAPSLGHPDTANAQEILGGGAWGLAAVPRWERGSHSVLWGPHSTQDRTQGPTAMHTVCEDGVETCEGEV